MRSNVLTVSIFFVVLVVTSAVGDAATATYRWQISNGLSLAGYTSNWSFGCGNQPTDQGLIVTTMTTAAFGCTADRLVNTQNAPQNMMLMISSTSYGSAMSVTGQTTGNRWYLRDSGGGSKTFRFTLGYAQGGGFTAWGFVDVIVPDGQRGLYFPDMSAISGVAPSGSNLALLVTKQAGNNEARIYLADENNSGDQSGQIAVDEVVACTPTGSLTVTPGQTLSGNPIDVTTISTATDATNLVYTVTEGACSAATSFDQMDDFAGLANGTRPSFGNWTGVNGSDGTLGWVALSGGTASGTTGPSAGNPDPYIYLESSASTQTYGVGVTGGSSQYVESNVLDASAYDFSFTFDWNINVNGNTNASLHLDAWNGAAWDLDVNGGTINTGNSGDVWVSAGPVDLSAYANADFQLRIRYVVGTTGTIWQNDFAFDNLHVTGTPKVTTLFTGTAVQAQSIDTTGWTPGTMCLTLSGDDVNCGTPLADGQDTFTWNAVNNSTTAGVVTASSSGCTAIAVSAPYAGDDNGDNSLTYRYRTPTGSGTWSAPVAVPHSVSPYGFSIGSLTIGAAYDVEVTFADVDDVSGLNPQLVSNILVGGDCTGAQPVSANQTTGATPSIFVTAPYTFDNNADNSLSYRFRTPSGTGLWSLSTTILHGNSPYLFTISNLVCGSGYDVEVTFVDPDGIGSGSAVQTVTNILLNECTTAGTVTAVVNGCDQITVSAPFARDANNDGTTSFEQGTAIGGPWATVAGCGAMGGVSPRTCVDSGLAASTDYFYRVTYSDPNGVGGVAQQIIGGFNTGVCDDPPVTTGVPAATADSCSQITVSAPYTSDTNNDSETLIEWNTSNNWPGTPACSALTGGSPRSCVVNSLSNASDYFFRITFTDPDGVNGVDPQVIGPIQTRDCRVTPLVPTASVDSCTQITVSATFTDDFNNDSSTSFDNGPSATGPWNIVCNGITGAIRDCVDTVTEASSYFYRVTFTDPDGTNGTSSQVIGPFATPVCAVPDTVVIGSSAEISSCRQITVASFFSGDSDGDGSTLIEFNTADSWPGTTACPAVSGSSPRACLVPVSPSTTYFVRATFSDPDGDSGTNPEVLGPFNVGTCAADQVAPTVHFLSPTADSIIGGQERIRLQIYDEGGLVGLPVEFSVDGGATSNSATPNFSFSCGIDCNIYEFGLDTTVLSNDMHYITVRVTDAANNVARVDLPFSVKNAGTQPAGDGRLLRRTRGSQICVDCHELATHSSQHTGTKYGNWALDCMRCHDTHGSTNIYLVQDQLQTVRSGEKRIIFQQDDAATGSNPQNSYLGAYDAAGLPYDDGMCEACHTQTNHYRNDASGGDHSHNRDSRCVGCHAHKFGFSARESEGGLTCSACHAVIWQGMTSGTNTSQHLIGSVLGTNDSFTDTNVSWSDPLSANVAAVRSCVNMCHQDHIHNPVAGTTHDYNVHQDASSQASRAVTRDAGGSVTAGTPNRTDFVAGSGGLCISCHSNSVDAARPAVEITAYTNSAHNFTSNTVGASTYSWTYTLHDGSTFDRNCTKCHAEDSTTTDYSAIPFTAVHYSDNPSLLSGKVNPAGDPTVYQCYDCHGNGATGQDRSGKDIATQIVKTSNHPTDDDAVHNSVNEWTNASFGNSLGGVVRHVNCLDCHSKHEVQAGTHTTPGNKAGPPLEGAWGAELSSNPSFWAAPAAGNFTKKKIVAGVDAEATLCFKCHSSYYGALPTSPSGGYQETDTAREFNPANTGSGSQLGAFHPVLASAGNNRGATSNIKAPWTRTSLMTCSDCHESNNIADPNGPHGSTAGFLLKGPNTLWNDSLSGNSGDPGSMPNGTFCINCHNQNYSGSRFRPNGSYRKGHGYNKHTNRMGAITCFNCHAAIPHGTARVGLLVSPRTQSIGGLQVTDAYPYMRIPVGNSGLQINSYPTSNTANWDQNDCECGDAGWGH